MKKLSTEDLGNKNLFFYLEQRVGSNKYALCKIVFLSIFLLSFGLNTRAQQLKGKITDNKANPLELATLQLFSAKDTTKPLQITLSDSAGNFLFNNLTKGNYLLKASYLHYPKVQLNFSLEKDTTLNIVLKENENEYSVTVKAAPNFLKKEGNKLVLNMEGIAIFKGKSALEVLNYAPFVNSDKNTGSITIKGNTAAIYVDGVDLHLSPSQAENYLNNLNSDEFEKVEIITNPAANADAANVGIINFITKKSIKRGIKGSLNSTAFFSKLFRSNNFLQLNGSISPKAFFNFYSGYNFNQFYRTERRTETLFNPAVAYNYDKKDISRSDYFTNLLTLHFTPNAQNEYGVGFTYTDWKGRKDQQNNLQISSLLDTNSIGKYTYNFKDIVRHLYLNYKVKNKKENQFLKLLFDYFDNRVEDNNFYKNDYYSTPNIFIKSNNSNAFTPSNYTLYAAQMDYEKTLDNQKFLIGAKYTDSKNRYHTLFQNESNGVFVENNNLSNQFAYAEKIAAAYFNYSKDSIWQKNSISIGIRAEYTTNTGSMPNKNYTAQNSYLNLFPSLSFSRNLAPNRFLIFSYTQKIIRPNYNSFNPTIFYLTDYTSQIGSPTLKPLYINAFELSYTTPQLSLLVYYNIKKDEAREILYRLNAAQLQYQWRNLDKANVLGAEGYFNKKLSKWLQVLVELSWVYKSYKATFEDASRIDQHKSTFQGKTSLIVELPSKIQAQIDFEYNGAELYGQFETGENYAFYASVSKKMGSNVFLLLKARDIFNTLRYKFSNIQNEIITTQLRNNYTQALSVSLTYSFGVKKNIKAKTLEKSSNELLNRLN